MPETSTKLRDPAQRSQEQTPRETCHHTRDTRRGQDASRRYRPAFQYHRTTEPPLPVCPSVPGKVPLSGSAGLWTSLAHRSYWIPGAYALALSEKHKSFLRLLKNKG